MNEFVVTIDKKKINVAFAGSGNAVVNGNEFKYSLSKLNNNSCKLFTKDTSYLITARKTGGNKFVITINNQEIEAEVLSALQERAANLIESVGVKHSITIIKSPMPGMILKIKKSVGDEVEQGDSLLILEAMKMENDIRSPVSGKIKEIKVKEGQAVEKGISILIVE